MFGSIIITALRSMTLIKAKPEIYKEEAVMTMLLFGQLNNQNFVKNLQATVVNGSRILAISTTGLNWYSALPCSFLLRFKEGIAMFSIILMDAVMIYPILERYKAV